MFSFCQICAEINEKGHCLAHQQHLAHFSPPDNKSHYFSLKFIHHLLDYAYKGRFKKDLNPLLLGRSGNKVIRGLLTHSCSLLFPCIEFRLR